MSTKVDQFAVIIVLAPLVDLVKIPASMYNIVSLVTNLKGFVPLPYNRGNVGGTHQALSDGPDAMS